MLNWLFWSIPREYVGRYMIMFWLVMFILPGYLLGLHFTKLGFIINWIWFDIIFYGWVKAKQHLDID